MKESGTRWRIVCWIKGVLMWAVFLVLWTNLVFELWVWVKLKPNVQISGSRGKLLQKRRKKKSILLKSLDDLLCIVSGFTQSSVCMGMLVHRSVIDWVRTEDVSCQLSLTLFLKWHLTTNLSSQRCRPFLLLLQCRKAVSPCYPEGEEAPSTRYQATKGCT